MGEVRSPATGVCREGCGGWWGEDKAGVGPEGRVAGRSICVVPGHSGRGMLAGWPGLAVGGVCRELLEEPG